jgi:probable rRNA maturation factor
MCDGNNLTVCLRDEEPQWQSLKFDIAGCCERALDASFEAAGKQGGGEVSILLSSDSVIAQLNQRYRGVEGPTNVLSFPTLLSEINYGSAAPRLLGDIVLSFETVVSEAETANITTEAHLAHMLVHGTLHLLGFDHKLRDEARVMETLEIQSLETLGIDNPYAKGSVRG